MSLMHGVGKQGPPERSGAGLKMDALAHAWAVLGLAKGSDMDALRARYRSLVRRWHPDQYAQDPQGQAEAQARMCAINDAYRQLLKASAPAPTGSSKQESRPTGRRLSREEIDRLVAAIGSESWVDSIPYGAVADWFTLRPGSQWKITWDVAPSLVFAVGAFGMLVLEWVGQDALNSRWWYLVFGAAYGTALVAPFRGRQKD